MRFMAKYIKKRKKDIGLSPFELVFRGEKKMEKPRLYLMSYDQTDVVETEIKSLHELNFNHSAEKFHWLNVEGLHEVKLMEKIAESFNIPFNIVSSIMDPMTRPQVQDYENGLFIVIKMLTYDENAQKLNVENLSFILTKNTLILFQEDQGDAFDPIRERIRKHHHRIRTAGTDYLACALLDVVIDNYLYLIGQLGDKIEDVEETMTKELDDDILSLINRYKRELNYLRKYIMPAKEMILNLAKLESEFIREDNHPYFKELQGNLNEVSELMDSYREILYDQLSIYHNTIGTRLNDIIKILTIFSVLFIPLTFIVGVYGTNFDYFPEIHWQYGYFAMWAVMLVIAGVMLWYFKKKKWL
jgi:magnesium transporter